LLALTHPVVDRINCLFNINYFPESFILSVKLRILSSISCNKNIVYNVEDADIIVVLIFNLKLKYLDSPIIKSNYYEIGTNIRRVIKLKSAI